MLAKSRKVRDQPFTPGFQLLVVNSIGTLLAQRITHPTKDLLGSGTKRRNLCFCKAPHHSASVEDSRADWRIENMLVEWNKDVDFALAHASQTGRPILLDFSAAPQ